MRNIEIWNYHVKNYKKVVKKRKGHSLNEQTIARIYYQVKLKTFWYFEEQIYMKIILNNNMSFEISNRDHK